MLEEACFAVHDMGPVSQAIQVDQSGYANCSLSFGNDEILNADRIPRRINPSQALGHG